jgi:hypothetical protein
MVNNVMHEAIVQQIVSDGAVRVNLRPIANILENLILQSLAPNVGKYLAANLPQIAVKDTLHSSLAEINIAAPFLAANLLQLQLAVFVHVLGESADVGFVGFYLAASTSELETGLVSHSFADSVKHEPRRVLADAQSPAKFVATDTVLAVRQHPESDHPFIKSKWGIFHDGADFDGELLFADVAEPNPSSLNEGMFGLSASWASNFSANPTKRNGSFKSPLWIAEVGDCTLQSLEAFHV